MDPYITLHGVSKSYAVEQIQAAELVSTAAKAEEKLAVSQVSLTIRKGERLGIVGRNGAGKSTLLRMIAGLSSPTSGSIEIVGKVTAIMTLGIGLRDDLSGRENIYVDGEIQGKSRLEIEPVIDEIIAFADLGEFIELPVRTYSTGMKARLAFSMITHIDPEIIIVDEALSVGDASFSTKATSRIMDICARGKIVIIVSHGMGSVTSICNRCLWMEDGRVIMDGSPDDVTKAYIDSVRVIDEAQLMERFRQFIGSRSMQAGWAIEDLSIFNGQTDEQKLVLEAGQSTRFIVKAQIPSSEVAAMVRARIIRLDDLVVFNELFLASTFRLQDKTISIEIEMNPLALGAAIYRLDVTLELGPIISAESAMIFEVFVLNPPTGGKPMLLYPISASIVPQISLHKVD